MPNGHHHYKHLIPSICQRTREYDKVSPITGYYWLGTDYTKLYEW